MTKKEYLEAKLRCINKSKRAYIRDMKYNYIILCGGKDPLRWLDGDAIVYGDKEDAEPDMVEGDILITEKEYYDSLDD